MKEGLRLQQIPADAIAGGVDLEHYRHTRRDVFGSRRSLQRFVAMHGEELLSAGALLSEGGRVTVLPTLFDEVVEAVGRHPSSARRLRESRAGTQ